MITYFDNLSEAENNKLRDNAAMIRRIVNGIVTKADCSMEEAISETANALNISVQAVNLGYYLAG